MKAKIAIAASLIALFAFIAMRTAAIQQATLPFRADISIGDVVYHAEGQAVVIGTVTPTSTPTPTDTPTPTSTFTPTPTDTLTPTPTDTPTPTPVDYDVGTHGWAYALPLMAAYSQDDATISVLVPSMMAQADLTYADLVHAAGYAGPTDSKIGAVRLKAANSTGANVVGYVPEGIRTSPSVPISETIYLELFLGQFVGIGQEHGLTLNYGPSLELISVPGSWVYHRAYDLDEERVAGLAAMLPDGSFWTLRVNTPEHMYADDSAGFRAAIQEMVDAIHAGNPTTRVILHLGLEPGGEDQFMSFLDATRGLVDQYYAGIDYPFPSDPYYDEAGTLASLGEVLRRTGAEPVPPTPSPVPPTDTPTPAPSVLHDLPYGPDPAHVLDLYLPAGAGPFPVVAWFHGGGFELPASKNMVQEQAAFLQAHGYAVAAVDYRQHVDGAPEFYLPAQLFDAKAAIRWIRANAGVYGLDYQNVGAVGGSAGAFLSALLGTSGDVPEAEGDVGDNPFYSSRVDAAVALAGVYDLLAYYAKPLAYCPANPEDSRCFESELFNCRFDDPACVDRMRLSSAYRHVTPDDPPFLLAIGSLDQTPNGLPDHRAMDEALPDSTLIVMDGYAHAELWPDVAPALLAFLDAHLKP